ncbi:aspartyl-tRNA(Asn)/glutamyl-tRNA(Gln) amidotransferase subunit A [Shimia gijangensis]|uniref:Aspartyl-tRNA(Asn)/glutamyl-tRNA(Gln) amidotransferase subunit A n=1 Tax=Shimia gijangensis TaxID=1470563 RepID=A0A1M6B1S6_9RHOB|nr:amidase family protein [Shimia gijangensis]SHI42665.1 aspartyl-tRNA(Asn)/glutamyl-tRNA(Gln) amidotransferase subunit A [Shimia gijangensis]
MFDWLEKSAADLGRGIGEGAIDPVALTQAFLGAIDSHDAKDRIYSVVTYDRALAEAEAAAERARAGYRLSPLDGVPISWKDLFDSAGVATEAGSRLLKDRVPAGDAEVMQNATALGLVCLGKTHMSELAFSGLGLNPMTATPPCINDPKAVPGGSSSGAAASVAFGLAAVGVGSDTGGSVRIPSAWNDLVGLKTTAGRVSAKGVVPLCEKFDTVGPLCRTVEDAALMLGVLEGASTPDLKGASLQGKRFAVLVTEALEDVREAPMAGFELAVTRLRDMGAEIEILEAPEVSGALALSGPLFTAEAYGQWRDVIEANSDLMFDQVLDRFRAGATFDGPTYVAAWKDLDVFRAKWHARVAGYDAVLLPTSPILPPDADRLMTDQDYYVTENLLALRNTRIGNLMGVCGMSLPTGVPSCGLMMLGAPMGEERLLRVAAAVEAVLRT